MAKRLHVACNVNSAVEERQTFGEHLADRVARSGGPWTFIAVFTDLLIAWAVVNTVVPARFGGALDPCPYFSSI